MREKLPDGWTPTTLGEVVDKPRSKAAPSEHPELPFVGMDSIAPGGMSLLSVGRFGDMKSAGGVFERGDVLYGRMRPYLNKVHLARERGACSAEFIVMPASDRLDGGFLAYLLHQRSFVNFASAQSSGDRPRVDFEGLASFRFGLPPKTEQQRIVSRIEELFSEIDEGDRALERAQKLVERYRQSVLKAAVAGELAGPVSEVLSPEARMDAIATARRSLWQSEAQGSRYPEPSSLSGSLDLPPLPAGWLWASIDQIGLVSGGLTKNRGRAERELTRPYLRVANVYANRLSLEEVHTIGVSEGELPRVTLKKDDLLVVEGNGSVDQIGRVALWDGSIPGCVHQNHLIKVRCGPVVPSWYVLVWCLSPLGRQYIERVASSSSGLHTLSISKIQSLPIPVPPAELLGSIRDEFDRMESMTGALASSLADEARRANALRQAVLRSAFSGQLVPQDPTDEPASALLARLAESAEAPPASPRRRQKTTA